MKLVTLPLRFGGESDFNVDTITRIHGWGSHDSDEEWTSISRAGYDFPIDIAMPVNELRAILNAASERPSATYRPSLKRHFDTHEQRGWWSASYDDLRVVGDTPEEAMEAFDREWRGDRS